MSIFLLHYHWQDTTSFPMHCRLGIRFWFWSLSCTGGLVLLWYWLCIWYDGYHSKIGKRTDIFPVVLVAWEQWSLYTELTQLHINEDSDLQDILDMLNEAGLKPDDDEGYGEFINCINKMWNNTRMIVNLSFTIF